MFDLDKTLRINMLLDFYSNLLTDKQKAYMDLYFQEDLSLSEIADQFSISRNAVHDNLNRTIKLLDKYEEKLQLLEKFNKRNQVYDEMREKYFDDIIEDFIKRLEELE